MPLSLSPLIVFACRVAETRSISRYGVATRLSIHLEKKMPPSRLHDFAEPLAHRYMYVSTAYHSTKDYIYLVPKPIVEDSG